MGMVVGEVLVLRTCSWIDSGLCLEVKWASVLCGPGIFAQKTTGGRQ